MAPSMRSFRRGVPASSVIDSSTCSQIPQVIGVGPFRLNTFSQVTGKRVCHRFGSAEGRAMFKEDALRFGLIIEDEYEVK